jgi:hypothetical protein
MSAKYKYETIFQIFPLEVWSDIIAYLGYLTVSQFFAYKKTFQISGANIHKIFRKLELEEGADISNLPTRLTHLKYPDKDKTLSYLKLVAETIRVVEFFEIRWYEFYKTQNQDQFPNLKCLTIPCMAMPHFILRSVSNLDVELRSIIQHWSLLFHGTDKCESVYPNVFSLKFESNSIISSYYFDKQLPNLKTFMIDNSTIFCNNLTITLPKSLTNLIVGKNIEREESYFPYSSRTCTIMITNLKNLVRLQISAVNKTIILSTYNFGTFDSLKTIHLENTSVENIIYPKNLTDLTFINCVCTNYNFLRILPSKLLRFVCILTLFCAPDDFEIELPSSLLHLEFNVTKNIFRDNNVDIQFNQPIESIFRSHKIKIPKNKSVSVRFWPKNFFESIPDSLVKLELFLGKKYNWLNLFGKIWRDQLVKCAENMPAKSRSRARFLKQMEKFYLSTKNDS